MQKINLVDRVKLWKFFSFFSQMIEIRRINRRGQKEMYAKKWPKNHSWDRVKMSIKKVSISVSS